MKAPCFIVGSVLVASVGFATDLSALAGHYHYQQYLVSLPNGRHIGLQEMGATDAYLDIAGNGTITLRMNMNTGRTVTETANVSKLEFAHGKGYWIAQWPDMNYPVRAEFTLVGGVLTSDTRFEDRSDSERFGSVEHAVLEKVGRP